MVSLTAFKKQTQRLSPQPTLFLNMFMFVGFTRDMYGTDGETRVCKDLIFGKCDSLSILDIDRYHRSVLFTNIKSVILFLERSSEIRV